MSQTEQLLKHIQRTNPGMTESKMLEELSKSRYASLALVMVWQNEKRSACEK